MADYLNLGTVFLLLGEHVKAKEYHEKALVITIEIGDREGEAVCYGFLGVICQHQEEYVKAKEHEKALVIYAEIGNREGEATFYGTLGSISISVDEYAKAEEYLEKAVSMCKDIVVHEKEFEFHCKLALAKSLAEKRKKRLECCSNALKNPRICRIILETMIT